MATKYFITFIVHILINSVSSKSFTMVIDTTDSMGIELDVIKTNLPAVISLLANEKDFENFIVVPFNDLDVEIPLVASKPAKLLVAINSLTTTGVSDCPEDSLAGIQKALEISQPDSQIYVFTDAYAKHNRNFRDIEVLCKSTQSQVSIFLSGNCVSTDPRNVGNLDVYFQIASVCSGAVFRLDAINLKKAFKFVKEIIKTDYNEISNYAEYNGYKQFTFTVDTFTTDILLAVSGDYPVLQIVDSSGRSPDTEKIIDMRQLMVVHLPDLSPGQYRASARSHGTTLVTFYKRNRMPFQYGFSTRIPNSLMETTLHPMPGRENYIFIKLHENDNIKIESVQLEYLYVNLRITLKIEEKVNQRGCYIATVFVEPAKPFKITIFGKDLTTYKDIVGSTKVITPQKQVPNPKWNSPTSEIIVSDSKMIDFGTNTTVACKVTGYPRPTIWWEDDAEKLLESEDLLLEIPSTYISYANIINMAHNFTIYCKSRNSVGEDVSNIELFVNRTFTFDILQSPQDMAIEYGESGKLYCEVDAYPEAKIKWYRNDTSVDYLDNIEVIEDENALEIKNMTLNDIGIYTCELSNIVNTDKISATISISGLDSCHHNTGPDSGEHVHSFSQYEYEKDGCHINPLRPEMPQVKVRDTQVIKKPGDWVELVCSVEKGNPAPRIGWKYKSEDDYDFKTLPEEVFAEGDKIKIPAVKMVHKGVYRCMASNMLGEDTDDVTVNIQYLPKISIDHSETLVVKEGDLVELLCEVDAVPAASVKWEMTQDDVIIPFDNRHSTNDEHTHRFYALWKDSGLYHCVAENEVGRTEKTVSINVLVAPYIEPPEFMELNVRTGDTVSLPCNVLYGNPMPTVKWDFIALDSSAVTLSSGTYRGVDYALNLANFSKANEGLYLCVADNVIGNDRIRIYLKA